MCTLVLGVRWSDIEENVDISKAELLATQLTKLLTYPLLYLPCKEKAAMPGNQPGGPQIVETSSLRNLAYIFSLVSEGRCPPQNHPIENQPVVSHSTKQ